MAYATEEQESERRERDSKKPDPRVHTPEFRARRARIEREEAGFRIPDSEDEPGSLFRRRRQRW